MAEHFEIYVFLEQTLIKIFTKQSKINY